MRCMPCIDCGFDNCMTFMARRRRRRRRRRLRRRGLAVAAAVTAMAAAATAAQCRSPPAKQPRLMLGLRSPLPYHTYSVLAAAKREC